ncbi:hypothetical protein WQ54_23995 [Bacillus sp. SA1-12]|uniref:MFS transporter n=1 Tax=Bacillus sp. SA1-12 TaxID=1455638 RepID=UPI000626EDA6|nr:MFS transporter [Bacillus sp. SA1-12]KKI89796.1 hypothetical protein WQ54_23995 [Bacillus sp. SA1-12]
MVRISLFIYLLFSTFSVMGFFLPLYLQSKGLTSGQIGSIIALGAFASIFGQPFWGYVSDKKKTIKRIVQMSLISSFLLSIGLFSSEKFHLIMLFYAMFIFFNCSAGPLTETLCLSYAYQNNKDFGRMRLWGEVGVGTASLFLGIIIDHIGINYLSVIYLVMLCITIAATTLVRDTKASTASVNIAVLKQIFTQPKLLWFLLMILLIAIPHRMNDTMLAIYLIQLGASKTQLGLAWLVATLSTIPALLFVGKLIKKWNELGIFVIAAFVYTLRWIIYSQADSPSVLIISQLLHSLTFPLLLVASLQYILNIVPSEFRATGQAAFSVTFGGIAGIIGNAAGGYIFEKLGSHTTYGVGSIFALIGTFAAIATYVIDKRSHKNAVISSKNQTHGTHIR